MKQTKYIVVAVAATLLSSCGIYTSYQRPEQQELPLDNLYDYIEATNEESNLASMEWRTLFTDPFLQRLIEQGLESNSDLRVAQLSVEQAEKSLSVARKSFLPSLDFMGNASSSNGNSLYYYAGVTAAWEIDIFGRLRNAREASRAALEQSAAYRQVVQTQLVASIAQCYYSLLMLDEQLEISLSTEQNWESNIRTMQALKSAGRINETAVLQSQASSLALSSQIVSLRESIAQVENSLSLLLSQPTTQIERGKLESTEFPAELGVGLPVKLLSNRPDVRMAESALAEAIYTLAEARSSLYPSITLSGSALYDGDVVFNAVAALVQPLLNRGTLKAQVSISEADEQKALIAFSQAILKAGTEVNDALKEWQSADQRLGYTLEQCEMLEQAATKTELMMRYGSATYLEVLTAQLSLLQARLSISSERYNLSQGVVNLYRALGGGEE